MHLTLNSHQQHLSNEDLYIHTYLKYIEMEIQMQAEDFTDQEAINRVICITSSNFGLLHRLLIQVEHLLEVNNAKTVTKEVVEVAWESLIIGKGRTLLQRHLIRIPFSRQERSVLKQNSSE